MAVLGGVGSLIGTSIGIATAGVGMAATIPLALFGLYAGYKVGDAVAESVIGYRCPDCGTEITADRGSASTHRLEAGDSERDEEGRYCIECGAAIGRHADVCPNCGVHQPENPTTDTDRVTAGVLAILLGILGAHKFYQGNTKLGIVYACLSWTAIPILLGWIEGALMLKADDETYQRKYADGSVLGD